MTAAAAPRVSIIMGVYNCAETLPAAIDSILDQTFADWELIVCDDGSTDATLAVARRYADEHPRITVLANDTNRTLAPTLNRCLAAARGELVARMDGDDLSEPGRLAALVDHLDAHPELGLVSSAMTLFDNGGVWGVVRPAAHPTVDELDRGTPFAHSPAMIRAATLRRLGGYSEAARYRRVEDYELWTRFLRAGHRGENLTVPLYRMRNDRDAASRRTWSARLNEARLRHDNAVALGARPLRRARAAMPLVLAACPPALYRAVYRRRHARAAATG